MATKTKPVKQEQEIPAIEVLDMSRQEALLKHAEPSSDVSVRQVLVITTVDRGTLHIDISEHERHLKVALALVNQRMYDGYYPQPTLPAAPDTPLAAIKKLPRGSLRTAGIDLWKQYDKDIAEFIETVNTYNLAVSAINDHDGKKAIEFLEKRKSFRGEGYSIERVIDNF